MKVVVLNVDDDQVTLMLHRILVKALGLDIQIEDFASGEEVLSYFKHYENPKATTFIMLLDINMPGLSGWDVLDRLEIHNELNVRVAMVTSSIDYRDQIKATEYMSVIDFLIKPISKDQLKLFFDKALGINE